MNIDRRSDKKHGGWGNREKNEEEKKVERQKKEKMKTETLAYHYIFFPQANCPMCFAQEAFPTFPFPGTSSGGTPVGQYFP